MQAALSFPEGAVSFGLSPLALPNSQRPPSMRPTKNSKLNKDEITGYTDGSCHPNPHGTAGWAFAVYSASMNPLEPVARWGWFTDATTNEAELMAIGMLAWYLRKKEGCSIKVHTDSMYALNCLSNWVNVWKYASGNPDRWETALGGKVANARLIWGVDRLLGHLRKSNTVQMFHVKGHKGNYWNELCDRCASKARQMQETTLKGAARIGPLVLGRSFL